MPENLSSEMIGLIWISAGVILMILEIFVPGGFVAFIGVSAVATGLLSFFNVIESVLFQFLFWAVFALIMILAFRRQLKKWFPALERYQPTTDFTEMYGKEVTAITEVNSESEEGRVRFQGTSWKAKTNEGAVQAGEKAKIIGKKNIVLFVEKI